ncbi:MAG: zinc ribbon domain-containing protein [Candidatus Aminicenantes bacterium]|nr:zinc ribbon domain-containing protein [Candidatus Aminicenantes bacterium]
MNTWNLKETDIYYLLRDSNLEPIPGSPLSGLEPAARSAELTPVKDKPGLIQALYRLARPETVLGMATFSPPDEPAFSWFYGSAEDGNFAFHETSEDGGHEIGWPADGFLILRSLQAPLALEKFAEKEDISLALDRAGFETVAVLSDWLQEVNLLSLLRREAPREMTFRETELLECCDRTRDSQDYRWMVPRSRLISPIGLDFSDDDIRLGLESLLAGRLLIRRDGVLSLSTSLGLACSRLAAVSGMSALSTQRQGTLSHVVALRIAGIALYLAEFRDIAADDFAVKITSVSQTDIYQRFKAGVGLSDPRKPAAPPEKKYLCPSCGNALRAGARFCAKCGYRLEKKR